MTKLAILNDFPPPQRLGGASRAIDLFLKAGPQEDVVVCTPGMVEKESDAYILFLTKTFSDDELSFVMQRPYVWCGFDWWPDEDGGSKWRNVLVERAKATIFVSPLHLSRFTTRYAAQPYNAHILPPPLDLSRLRQIQQPSMRDRAVWASEWHSYKGPDLAAVLARKMKIHVDMFSPTMPADVAQQQSVFTPFAHPRGTIPDEAWYEVLGNYGTLLHTPRVPDAFGYIMLEAYALGLKVYVTGRTGVESYNKKWSHLLEECGMSAQSFWKIVEGTL